MKPQTVSDTFFKVMPIVCRRNDALDDLDIQGNCFALLILYEGRLQCTIDGHTIDAVAPCFLCFDEHATPTLIHKEDVVCHSIYFEPMFININMTYERIHGQRYGEIADLHDLFLLMPFTDEREYVFPLFMECMESTRRAFDGVEHDLLHQRDWYWPCRSRSYFMELMFILERAYGYIGSQENIPPAEMVQNTHLQKAILYIENHYPNSVTLADIAAAARINHTSLTRLFKAELHTTPVQYLWHHRLKVAKKQLEFTRLPIKDIATRCGFKTVPHFTRKFEANTGYTPADFREYTWNKRIQDLG